MTNPELTPFDHQLAAALRGGRSVAVPGLAERVVAAILAERRRRVVIRWGSAVTVAAGLMLLITLGPPSEETLNRRTFALVAQDEFDQLGELFGAAADLSLLAPVMANPSVVEILDASGS